MTLCDDGLQLSKHQLFDVDFLNTLKLSCPASSFVINMSKEGMLLSIYFSIVTGYREFIELMEIENSSIASVGVTAKQSSTHLFLI